MTTLSDQLMFEYSQQEKLVSIVFLRKSSTFAVLNLSSFFNLQVFSNEAPNTNIVEADLDFERFGKFFGGFV